VTEVWKEENNQRNAFENDRRKKTDSERKNCNEKKRPRVSCRMFRLEVTSSSGTLPVKAPISTWRSASSVHCSMYQEVRTSGLVTRDSPLDTAPPFGPGLQA
jgi:hypothetical protein